MRVVTRSALTIAVLVALCIVSAVSWSATRVPSEPLTVMPTAVAGEAGSYAFQTPSVSSSTSAREAAGSGSLRLHAVVLAVRIIVVEDGSVKYVHANSDQRSKGQLIFIVREGSVDGPARALTPKIWNTALPALRTTVSEL